MKRIRHTAEQIICKLKIAEQLITQGKAELFRIYQIGLHLGLNGLKKDFVDLLQNLRPQTALEKGLYHGHRKGVLRLM